MGRLFDLDSPLIRGLNKLADVMLLNVLVIVFAIPLIVEQATGQAASSQLMWPIIQGILLVLGSSQYSLDSGYNLTGREGFYDVIVCSELKT